MANRLQKQISALGTAPTKPASVWVKDTMRYSPVAMLGAIQQFPHRRAELSAALDIKLAKQFRRSAAILGWIGLGLIAALLTLAAVQAGVDLSRLASDLAGFVNGYIRN